MICMASIGGSVPGIPSIRIISPWFTAGVYTAVTWSFLAPTIPKLTFYVAETNYLYTVYICLRSTFQLSVMSQLYRQPCLFVIKGEHTNVFFSPKIANLQILGITFKLFYFN